jgi:hypothetical protein
MRKISSPSAARSIKTYIHTYIQTNKNIYTFKKHAYTYTCIHACIHTFHFLKRKSAAFWDPCWARAVARQSARDAGPACRAAACPNTPINQNNTVMLRTACFSAGGALRSARAGRADNLRTNAINYKSWCAGPAAPAGSSSGEHNACKECPLDWAPHGCFK